MSGRADGEAEGVGGEEVGAAEADGESEGVSSKNEAEEAEAGGDSNTAAEAEAGAGAWSGGVKGRAPTASGG